MLGRAANPHDEAVLGPAPTGVPDQSTDDRQERGAGEDRGQSVREGLVDRAWVRVLDGDQRLDDRRVDGCLGLPWLWSNEGETGADLWPVVDRDRESAVDR